MKHEIIKTKNYLLIVDDSEIKEGDWCLANIVAGDFYGVVKYNGAFAKNYYEKIIAYLPLNNSPILKGVDLLPPLEDDVEKLAKEYFNNITPSDSPYQNGLYIGFKAGYNKAKEKHNYTEEDMIKCWKYASIDKNQIFGDQIGDSYMSFIQSLQQPKMPVGFKCDMIYRVKSGTIQEHKKGKAGYEYYEPKTTTNSQGHKVWVGEYKYDSLKELKIINQEDDYTEQKFYDLLPDVCLIEDTTNENTNNQRCMGYNACKKCFNNFKNSVITKNK